MNCTLVSGVPTSGSAQAARPGRLGEHGIPRPVLPHDLELVVVGADEHREPVGVVITGEADDAHAVESAAPAPRMPNSDIPDSAFSR